MVWGSLSPPFPHFEALHTATQGTGPGPGPREGVRDYTTGHEYSRAGRGGGINFLALRIDGSFGVYLGDLAKPNDSYPQQVGTGLRQAGRGYYNRESHWVGSLAWPMSCEGSWPPGKGSVGHNCTQDGSLPLPF